MQNYGTGVAPAVEPEIEAPRRWYAATLVWEHRGFLFHVARSTFLFSCVLVFLIPVRYESTAQLMPPNQGIDPGIALLANMTSSGASGVGTSSLAGAASGLASSLLGSGDEGQMIIGVMRSQSVEDSIINSFNLMDRYGTRYIEDARTKLEDKVDIEEDRKSGIISISVDDQDPEIASKMAHFYVDRLNYLLAQVNTSAAHRERLFVEQRLKEVKQNLDKASQEFSQFSSKNTTIDLPEQGRAMMDAAAELEGQIIAAQSQLSGLRQMYTESNIRVKQTEAQITELQRQLDKFGGKDIGGKLPATNDTLVPPIRALPLLGVKYADLYRTLKINETVYEMLTQAYELAKVEEAREVPSVQVLDPGVVPTKKSFPPRGLLVLLVTFLITCIAGVFVVARERWIGLDPADERKTLLSEIYGWVAALPVWQWKPVRKTFSFFRWLDGLPGRGTSWVMRKLRRQPAEARAES